MRADRSPIGRALVRLGLSARLARLRRFVRDGDFLAAFDLALRLRRAGGLSRRSAGEVADALAAIASDADAHRWAPDFTARLVAAANGGAEPFLRSLAAFQLWVDRPAWPPALRARLREAAAGAADADSLLFGTSFCETAEQRAALITAMLERRGLGGAVTAGTSGVPLEFRASGAPPARADTPVVSVVMTAFDATATIRPAVASVMAQSVTAIELIIVDDASRDGSWAAIRDAARHDPRVRGVRLATNGGTYRAKNIGLARARGRFITFHDSDDVSHPEKLARQLAAIVDGRQASMSRWVRVGPDGVCVASFAGSFVWRNKSSLMIRREVVDRIGPFDRVRVSADSEFHDRILAAFGPHAIAEIDEPLSLGSVRPDSLTQAAATRMTHTFVAPVRLAYEDAYRAWHAATPADRLVMPGGLGPRPFAAPEAIASGAADDAVAETI